MPNRIIKESICTSEKIAELTDFEFRLWVSLITLADDMGRGDARPAIIKGRAFPLRDRVTIKDIDGGVHGLAAKGCVSLYTVGGRPYFWFPTWQNHQRVRDCKAKYPGPEDADVPPQPAATCGNLRQPAATCGLNPIQSESNPNPESESESNPRAGAFAAFWAAYPRKVGKEAARRAFAKIPKEAWPLLVPAINAQKLSRQWQKDGGQYIPNPATWLNQGRWEDEAAEAQAQTNNPFLRQLMEEESHG